MVGESEVVVLVVVVEMLGAAIPSQHWAMAFGLKIVAGQSIRSKNSFRRISRSGEREFDFLAPATEARSNNVEREREGEKEREEKLKPRM